MSGLYPTELLPDGLAKYAQVVPAADLSDLVRSKAGLQHCVDNDVVEPGRLICLSRIPTRVNVGPLMEFQTRSSRRQFLSAVARTAGAAIMLGSHPGWAVDMTDPRVADIVAKTIGIDT